MFKTQAEIEAQDKALVWTWYEAKLNHDAVMIHTEILTPDFVGHGSDSPDAMPIEVLFAMFSIEGREQPGTARPLEPLIADGDRVALRYKVGL